MGTTDVDPTSEVLLAKTATPGLMLHSLHQRAGKEATRPIEQVASGNGELTVTKQVQLRRRGEEHEDARHDA